MPTKKPQVPHGLRELLLDLTEKVVLSKPVNICLFCAKYLEKRLLDRDGAEASDVPPAERSERVASTGEDSCTTSPRSTTPANAIFKLTSTPAIVDVLLSPVAALSSSTGKDGEPQPAAHQHKQHAVIATKVSRVAFSNAEEANSNDHVLSSKADAGAGDANNPKHRTYPVRLCDDTLGGPIVPSVRKHMSLEFAPRPPTSGARPPARPLHFSWTAMQLSRLAARRCMRAVKITSDSSRSVPLATPLDATSPGSLAESDTAKPIRDGGADVEIESEAVTAHLDFGNTLDEESDVESNMEWWLDDLEPKQLKRVRRRKKQPRNNKHGGRWCSPKRPEIVFSFDSYSDTHVRALVYVGAY